MKIKDLIIYITIVILIIAFLFAYVWLTRTAETTALEEQLAVTTKKLDRESKKINELQALIEEATKQLTAANDTIVTLKNTEYKFLYIGDFKITHYCTEATEHICGTGDGLTATGAQVEAGQTIAVDPEIIPYGVHVYIDGYGWRIAEDCGAAVQGKHIDMAVETHEQALNMGVKTKGVWVIIRQGS